MSCSSDDQSDKECPLCMEPLEIDDIDFYPCKCEYQICRFCWHRLLTNENGLCPACRQPYPEDPVNFKPLSSADLQKIKDEKKMKQQAEKLRISESRKHLANYRVLQKNLVYVVGLSSRVATEDMLRKHEYFGRHGKILKVVTGTTPTIGAHIQPSHTAYVTYSRIEEALKAIQTVNNVQLDGRIVKASLGTTKYCSAFLRSQICGKPDCMYLHDIADDDISFTKDDMHMGKHTEYEKRLIEQVLTRKPQQQLDKRPANWSNKNICWEKNGRETNEQPVNGKCNGSEQVEQISEESESISNTQRRNSQNKENQCEPILVADVHESEECSEVPDSDVVYEKNDDTKTNLSVSPESDDQDVPSNSSKALRFLELSSDHFDSGRGTVPAPAPREEAPAPLMNWQTLLGLTPSDNSSKSRASPPPGLNGLLSDDDLGFDPFNESTKGLAKLLEEERIKKQPSHNSFPSTVHSTSLRDLWPRNPQSSNSQRSAFPQPLDMFNSSFQMGSGFHNGFQQSSFYDQIPSSQSHSSSFGPPGLVPPRSHQSFSQPQSITEWQEGLKALLPNVNVRFASDIDSQHHQQNQQQRWQPSYTSHSQMIPHSVPPPPGFSVPNR